MSSIHGDYRIPPTGGSGEVNISQNVAGMFKTLSDFAKKAPAEVAKDRSDYDDFCDQITDCLEFISDLVNSLPKSEAKNTILDQVLNTISTARMGIPSEVNTLIQELNTLASDAPKLIGNLVTPTILSSVMNKACTIVETILTENAAPGHSLSSYRMKTVQVIMDMFNNMPCFHRDQNLNMPQAPDTFANMYNEYFPDAIGALKSNDIKDFKQILNYILSWTPPISDWYNQVSS